MTRPIIFVTMLLIASSAVAQIHQGVGVVTKIDQAKGSVMVKHEAVKSLDWPGMTMGFAVRDKSMLTKLKPEQKINFEFVVEKGRYVITAVK